MANGLTSGVEGRGGVTGPHSVHHFESQRGLFGGEGRCGFRD